MQPVKQKKIIFYIFFIIFTITLLIAASIYCYIIKYKTKQKHLWSCDVKNNKLKKFYINHIL